MLLTYVQIKDSSSLSMFWRLSSKLSGVGWHLQLTPWPVQTMGRISCWRVLSYNLVRTAHSTFLVKYANTVFLVAIVLFTICAAELLLRFSYGRPVRHPLAQTASRLSETEISAKESGRPLNYSRWSGVDTRLIFMLWGLAIAITFLIIRSIYRTIELANGW